MMKKTILAGILAMAMAMAACAARPAIQVTPAQRAQAVAIVASGGTVRDVAVQLSLSDRDARRLVKETARQLTKWVSGSYDDGGGRTVTAPVVVPASAGPAPAVPPLSPVATCNLDVHAGDASQVGVR